MDKRKREDNLRSAFSFSEEDLKFNEMGVLSPGQRRKLQRWRVVAMLALLLPPPIFVAISLYPALIIYLNAEKLDSVAWWLPVAGGAFTVWLSYLLLRKLRRYGELLRANQVFKLEGTVATAILPGTFALSNTVFRIQGREFRVPKRQFDALRGGDAYQVFFARVDKHIFSVKHDSLFVGDGESGRESDVSESTKFHYALASWFGFTEDESSLNRKGEISPLQRAKLVRENLLFMAVLAPLAVLSVIYFIYPALSAILLVKTPDVILFVSAIAGSALLAYIFPTWQKAGRDIRLGKLAATQFIQGIAINVLALLLIPVYGGLVFAAESGEFAALGLACGALFLYLFSSWWRLNRDLRAGKTANVRGKIKLRMEVDVDGRKKYRIEIKQWVFRISKEQYNFLWDDSDYRIYFLPSVKRILSIESLFEIGEDGRPVH